MVPGALEKIEDPMNFAPYLTTIVTNVRFWARRHGR